MVQSMWYMNVSVVYSMLLKCSTMLNITLESLLRVNVNGSFFQHFWYVQLYNICTLYIHDLLRCHPWISSNCYRICNQMSWIWYTDLFAWILIVYTNRIHTFQWIRNYSTLLHIDYSRSDYGCSLMLIGTHHIHNSIRNVINHTGIENLKSRRIISNGLNISPANDSRIHIAKAKWK